MDIGGQVPQVADIATLGAWNRLTYGAEWNAVLSIEPSWERCQKVRASIDGQLALLDKQCSIRNILEQKLGEVRAIEHPWAYTSKKRRWRDSVADLRSPKMRYFSSYQR